MAPATAAPVSSVSRQRVRSSGGRASRSPKNRMRNPSFSIFSRASSRYLRSRSMIAETSSTGRFQFSVEKA